MKSYYRSYTEINLDAMEYNIEQLRENIKDTTKIMLVVKADGYNHGALVVAKSFEDKSFIWGFAVASLEEAMILRQSGIKKSIMVLGAVYVDQYEELIENDISLTVYCKERSNELVKIAKKLNKKVKMHIKLDTGMSRLGFECDTDTVKYIEELSKETVVKMEGIMTHFARADETDKSHTNEQYKKFVHIIDQLKLLGVSFEFEHCANSPTTIDMPQFQRDMVRIGFSSYGLYSSSEVNRHQVALKPALSWHSIVASVKLVKAGNAISYGGSYVTKEDRRIATIPVGYADGYFRSLSNVGSVLICGKRAPIVGKVCMDQFMVDVTDIDQADYMSHVTLIGVDGEDEISLDEITGWSQKFNYEFLCGIGKRIPRNYIKNGEIVEQMDYFA